ncbi:MAG TPA: competence type IV pilus minor pilin ComGD [Bacillales bacterium]|nr:competence type IV pilus minor pilin ComGD [Bacillales bacterium]
MQTGKHKEGGFTLIETLIVLFIIAAVTSIVFVSFRSLHTHKQTQYFLEQLKKDLYFAQAFALSHDREVDLTFKPQKHLYTVTDGSATIFKRTYDGRIKINSNFGRTVEFNSNGNIARFGTLHIQTRTGRFRVVFHIGKGRFYVKKS